MKKTGLIVLIIGAIILLYSWNTYNHLVKLDEQVIEKWSQVQNVYQRRADLIPNLVNTVKGYATHEEKTLTEVVQARSQVAGISPAALKEALNNPASFNQFTQAQNGLSQALSHLMVVVESYPNLKADTSFLELQSQLEGTENRITVERQRFNEVTQEFNRTIRLFPGNILARLFNFERKSYFEATPGAEKVPNVQFQ